MTEEKIGYDAGGPEPKHQWVECSVRVPSVDKTGDAEIQCLAKVRCDDLIDALDLNRWSAVAFQHLWASCRGQSKRELHLALWYLKRATAGHHAEARAVATLLRKLVELADGDDRDLRSSLLEFAADAEVAEFAALELIHEAASSEH